jgi:hypothetical protein
MSLRLESQREYGLLGGGRGGGIDPGRRSCIRPSLTEQVTKRMDEARSALDADCKCDEVYVLDLTLDSVSE